MANNQRPRAAPRPEKNVSESEGGGESVCVVCFKPIVYFAIGECDHLCCYECSTRIRVLCRQNDCPICRRDLSKVTEAAFHNNITHVHTRTGHTPCLYDLLR